jgi:serine/threonine protein kinase
MKPDRWRQIDKILHDVLEQEQHQRPSFLDRVCGDDQSLRKEVEALIISYEEAGSFLDSPAVASLLRSLVGKTFGPYEVKALLGSGGMGEVYRGRDSNLKRDVAIKVLPDEFSCDSERLTRFQREAEILASLNHPHIAAIYDMADFGKARFLVLELVEGETLADRLRRGPVPIDEALRIGRQIAVALEAAHEKGIIHRDLKPANIKITPQGNVKVLDFGLAKVLEAEGAHLSSTPTKVTASGRGIVMGTPAYMSPEQAKGSEADHTSDVWAFGCVLYAMLTARAVFQGETAADILAGVLKAEPDWHLLPSEIPEGIRRLLRRCLQKDRGRRLRDIADARLEIDEIQNAPRIPSPMALRDS